MKSYVKEWCQDFALLIGLYTVLRWTGANFDWYHWFFILAAAVVYGVMQGRRAIRFYQKHHKPVVLDRSEFDEWLTSHGVDPKHTAERFNK